MKITPVERMMFNVMKAIYESGIPISFKGSMVLKACLMEAGFTDETRHTVDIDATGIPPVGHRKSRWKNQFRTLSEITESI